MSREDFLRILVDDGPQTLDYLVHNAVHNCGYHTFKNMVRDGLIRECGTCIRKGKKRILYEILQKGREFLNRTNTEYRRGALYTLE